MCEASGSGTSTSWRAESGPLSSVICTARTAASMPFGGRVASPRGLRGEYVMRQLTSLDTQFLALETSRQTGHVGGLAILDPSTAPGGKVDLADMSRLMEERLPLLPPLRSRLVEVPFGLDYPYWVDDEDFDLDFHVRELALPAPGNREQLAEQVARIMGRPLDRARPLWEMYLIHGVERRLTALLTKVHHAV